MNVTREQLLELLADNSHPDAVWVMNADRTTRIVVPESDAELAELHSRRKWPMYLIRVDHAENYIREHGLDGAVKFLNMTFLFVPEPGSFTAKVLDAPSRLLARRA